MLHGFRVLGIWAWVLQALRLASVVLIAESLRFRIQAVKFVLGSKRTVLQLEYFRSIYFSQARQVGTYIPTVSISIQSQAAQVT